MIIRDGGQSIEITTREMGPPGTPAEGDLGLNVRVLCAEFSGRNDSVWIQRSDWNQFTDDLAQLERARKGQAILSAMSPNDFHLKVFASDRAGHMKAAGWVGREFSGRNGIVNRVSFEIEIDPTTLSILAEQFGALTRQ
jgi:hypothetical protein